MSNKLWEHERNMEHPMYKKGFQYVFDHYGVPRLPSEELIDLKEKYSKLSDEYKEYQETALSSVKETKKELEAMDKKLLDIVTKINRRDKTIRKLRYENNKKKKHIELLESTLESLRSKWYVKPFFNIT